MKCLSAVGCNAMDKVSAKRLRLRRADPTLPPDKRWRRQRRAWRKREMDRRDPFKKRHNSVTR